MGKKKKITTEDALKYLRAAAEAVRTGNVDQAIYLSRLAHLYCVALGNRKDNGKSRDR
ncbi:MAG: hypothetical protein JRJ29_00270 [Deltaproteobacteria bacterium]|nr:hypothetical protein [Deltaproteobacteria bacterium]MBW2081598.1 hypothetical protein [Deltaproteobacteria bacterium]